MRRRARRIPEGHVRWGTFLRMWKRRKSLQKPKADLPSDFDAYTRQVILYYSGPEHRELKELVGVLAQRFGTKNQSDTVLCALRALASKGESGSL